MPKMKTNAAAKKRFTFTGTGKIKRKHAYHSHILTKKTTKQIKAKHTNKWIRLKGKKKAYYARIRAYKIVNGKKYYSKPKSRT